MILLSSNNQSGNHSLALSDSLKEIILFALNSTFKELDLFGYSLYESFLKEAVLDKERVYLSKVCILALILFSKIHRDNITKLQCWDYLFDVFIGRRARKPTG